MLGSLEDLPCFVTEVVFKSAALERGLTVVLDFSCNSSYFIVAMSETVFNIRLSQFCTAKILLCIFARSRLHAAVTKRSCNCE